MGISLCKAGENLGLGLLGSIRVSTLMVRVRVKVKIRDNSHFWRQRPIGGWQLQTGWWIT